MRALGRNLRDLTGPGGCSSPKACSVLRTRGGHWLPGVARTLRAPPNVSATSSKRPSLTAAVTAPVDPTPPDNATALLHDALPFEPHRPNSPCLPAPEPSHSPMAMMVVVCRLRQHRASLPRSLAPVLPCFGLPARGRWRIWVTPAPRREPHGLLPHATSVPPYP